jgi:uroporphyrinogen decarboxylase
MNSRERVLCAIRHSRPDQTPKGDLAIEARLMRSLAESGGYRGEDANGQLLAALRLLEADIAHVHDYPVQTLSEDAQGLPVYRGAFGEEFAISEYGSALVKPAFAAPAEAFDYSLPDPDLFSAGKIDFFRADENLFITAQVGGPISSLDWALGMQNMLIWCHTDADAMLAFARQLVAFETGRACRFLDHGADAIVIADDMAYNSGPFMRPASMTRFAWPFYTEMIQRIKAHRCVPVFLHSDGDIRTLLPQIVACGFDGLQSLQPSAQMNILEVKRQYGGQLCLWGNLDLNHLMTFGTPEEIAEQARWLCRNIGADGGFILGTCNILIDAIPVENALAMYHAAL